MSIISLIAAIDEASGLGYHNQLLCHLPADLRHFKIRTLGKPVIMGRKTYESIGRPLGGRLNIVVSKTLKSIEGVVVVSSLDEAINQANDSEELMVIGGQQLFTEAIERASRLYLTQIHHRFLADVFFPKVDESRWYCKEKEYRQKDENNPYDLSFCLFTEVSKK